MDQICISCSYPKHKCSSCPLTFNYWTSLPQGFIISSSGTSLPISEGRIREIVKDEIGNCFNRAFSDGEPLKGVSFSRAFEHIREDATKGMRLPFWSPEVVIRVQNPDKNSKMTHPYLYVESRKGKVPWRETFPELFSNEWEIVECPIITDSVNKYDSVTSTVSNHTGPVTSTNVLRNSNYPLASTSK